MAFGIASLGLASAGILLGGSSEAFASVGCDAVEAGGFSDTVSNAGHQSKSISGFEIGDTITFTLTATNTGGANSGAQWWITGGPLLADQNLYNDGTIAKSYTVVGGADLTLNQVLRIQILTPGAVVTVTATCKLVTPVVGPTDSDKLGALQVQGSALVAQTSGAAITGAVGGAIDGAFSNGAQPITIGANGATINLTGSSEAKGIAARQWNIWADMRGTGWNSANSGDLEGTQINATAGIGYLVAPGLLVGAFAGYEDFKYEAASLSGTLTGDGGTVGGYAAWQIAPALRWDGMAGWSNVSYDGVAGTAKGSFSGSRWLASTGVTGNYNAESFVAESSARVYALWERQGAWTDSLGAAQDARDFSAGRVSVGGRVMAPWQVSAMSVQPYVGLYGDWRFSTDDALPADLQANALADGWSGRITGGVSLAGFGSGSLALGGEYGGLGTDARTWNANARASWAF